MSRFTQRVQVSTMPAYNRPWCAQCAQEADEAEVELDEEEGAIVFRAYHHDELLDEVTLTLEEMNDEVEFDWSGRFPPEGVMS